MDAAELRARIAAGESLHTELTEQVPQPESLAAELVAFANTDGGVLAIGVADDGAVTGVQDADAVARAVDNAAYNNCEPPVTVVQETIETDGQRVVAVQVPKGAQRPYRTRGGRYYVRTSSGRRDASREELLRLFQASESLYYDETPLVRLDLDAIDPAAVRQHLQATGQEDLGDDLPRLLRNWGLAANGHPTVAGLILFGREPQRHLPFAQIHAARFRGDDASTAPIDRKDLGGRLFDVIDQARRFLLLHLPVPHEIRGFDPEPRPELPEEALREALVNAVAHRDYTVQGPVRLFVLDDRIDLHTPGRPPNTVDADAMRAGVHVPRNPRLYARLSDAGLVTRAGTGIPRMIRLVRQASGRDVAIEVRPFEVLVSIPRRLEQAR